MGIAPSPQFPETSPTSYERTYAPSVPGNEGPNRFQEGLATDTDIPNEFTKGVMQGYIPGARPNHNQNVFEKWPEETIRERAHVGSASWVEAPTFLNEFASEAFTDHSINEFPLVVRSGAHYARSNPAAVQD